MNITGFLGEATTQVMAALTLVFIVVLVILAAKRSMTLIIGTLMVFGLLFFTISNPEWPGEVMGWLVEGVTR